MEDIIDYKSPHGSPYFFPYTSVDDLSTLDTSTNTSSKPSFASFRTSPSHAPRSILKRNVSRIRRRRRSRRRSSEDKTSTSVNDSPIVERLSTINIETKKTSKTKKRSPDSKHPRTETKIFGIQHVNKFCQEDLKECTDLKFGPVTYIGGGTFGSVFTTRLDRHHLVAIKMIISIDARRKSPKNLLKQQREIQREINTTVLMGKENIGPRVVEVVNYLLDNDELDQYPLVNDMIKEALRENDSKVNLNDQKKHEISIQFIIMDAYEMDCEKALFNLNYSRHHAFIFRDMVELMVKQIKIGIYCYDIKPSNFVVNMSVKPLEVRMIDFGSDFCSNKMSDIFPPNKFVNELLGIFPEGDRGLLLFSNCLQLFLYFVTGPGKGFFRNKTPPQARECFMVIFKYFPFVYDIASLDRILNLYIQGAYLYHEDELYRPPTMAMWYASLKYTKPEETIREIEQCFELFY